MQYAVHSRTLRKFLWMQSPAVWLMEVFLGDQSVPEAPVKPRRLAQGLCCHPKLVSLPPSWLQQSFAYITHSS